MLLVRFIEWLQMSTYCESRKFCRSVFLTLCYVVVVCCAPIGCSLFSAPKVVLDGKKVDVSDNAIPDAVVVDVGANAPEVTVPQQVPSSSKMYDGNIGGVGNLEFNWFGSPNSHKNAVISSFGGNKVVKFKIAPNYGFPLCSMPIITKNGTLLVLDTRGVLHAFNSDSGQSIWSTVSQFVKEEGTIAGHLQRYMMGGGIAISSDQDVVFVTNGSSHVAAFNVLDGRKIWDISVSSVVRSVPLVHNGTIIVQASNDTVYCIRQNNGKILWTHVGVIRGGDVRSSSSSSMVIGRNGDTLILQNTYGEIIVLRIADGSGVSHFDPQNHDNLIQSSSPVVTYAPILYDGHLYVVSNLGKLISINVTVNQVEWQKNLNLRQPFWIAGDAIYAVNGSGQLLAVRRNDGAVRWVVDLSTGYTRGAKIDKEINPRNMFSAPVVVGDAVSVVCYDGVLLGFDITTGRKVLEVPVHTRSSMPIMVHDNSLYIISKDGTITRYFMEDSGASEKVVRSK